MFNAYSIKSLGIYDIRLSFSVFLRGIKASVLFKTLRMASLFYLGRLIAYLLRNYSTL
jgi:hypothetical protein